MTIENNFNQIEIFQFGVGGTGSWLVDPLSKFLNNLNMRCRDLIINYHLIDDDVVSERNVLRQNFQSEDVGSFKNLAAKRRCFWFDRLYTWVTSPKTPKKISDLINLSMIRPNHEEKNLDVILGCTDSVKFRRSIYTYLKKSERPSIYIDSGNNLHNGQIITTIFNINSDYFRNADYFKNINIHKFFPKEQNQNENRQDCSYFGDQSQSINMFGANLIFANIQRIFIENLLPPSKIDFNSSGFSSFDLN